MKQAPRLLGVILVAALGLPSPALALRGQQPEDNSQRSGLEEALRNPDKTIRKLVQLVSSPQPVPSVAGPSITPDISFPSRVGLEEQRRVGNPLEIKGLAGPTGIAYDSDTGTIYVVESNPARLRAFDVRTGQPTGFIIPIQTGGPAHVVYSPAERRLFLAGYTFYGPRWGVRVSLLQAFDTQTGQPTGFKIQPDHPIEFVALDPRTRRLFLLLDRSYYDPEFSDGDEILEEIWAFDTQTAQPTGLRLGRADYRDTRKMAVDPIKGRLFVLSERWGTVDSIDTQTSQETILMKGLQHPRGIAFDGSNQRIFVMDDWGTRLRAFHAQTGQPTGFEIKDLLRARDVVYDSLTQALFVLEENRIRAFSAVDGTPMAIPPKTGLEEQRGVPSQEFDEKAFAAVPVYVRNEDFREVEKYFVSENRYVGALGNMLSKRQLRQFAAKLPPGQPPKGVYLIEEGHYLRTDYDRESQFDEPQWGLYRLEHRAEIILQGDRRIGFSDEYLLPEIRMAKTDLSEVQTRKGSQVKEELISSEVSSIVKWLEDADLWVRQAALHQLGRLGDSQAYPYLIKALEDQHGFIRTAAARALGTFGDPQAVPSLLKALEDKGADVRSAAAQALGAIGDPLAIPNLVRALRDKNADVRNSAVIALDHLGWIPEGSEERVFYLIANKSWDDLPKLGSVAVPPLIETFEGIEEKGWDRIGSDIAEALLSIARSTQDVAVWARLLELNDVLVQVAAAEALEKVGDPKAIPNLVKAVANGSGVVRAAAAEALGKIGVGDPQVISVLIKALEDPDPSQGYDIRRAAAEALGTFGGPQVIPALTKALGDEHSDVRAAAAEALGKIRDPRAIPSLTGMLQDSQVFVRLRVAGALDQLGWRPGSPEEWAVYLFAKTQWNELVKLGSTSLPVLIKGLQDRDTNEGAAWALTAIAESTQDIGALMELLEVKHVSVAKAAAEGLGKLRQGGKAGLEEESIEAVVRRLPVYGRHETNYIGGASSRYGPAPFPSDFSGMSTLVLAGSLPEDKLKLLVSMIPPNNPPVAISVDSYLEIDYDGINQNFVKVQIHLKDGTTFPVSGELEKAVLTLGQVSSMVRNPDRKFRGLGLTGLAPSAGLEEQKGWVFGEPPAGWSAVDFGELRDDGRGERMVFSPDGTKLAVGFGLAYAEHGGGGQVWDVESGKVLGTFSHVGPWVPDYDATYEGEGRHMGGTDFLAFSPDGTRLLTHGIDEQIHMRDVKTGQTLRSMRSRGIPELPFLPDGSVVVPSKEKRIVVEASTGKYLRDATDEDLFLTSGILSPDRTRLATISLYWETKEGSIVQIWDVKTGTLLHTLDHGLFDIKSVSFSPDGKRLVTLHGGHRIYSTAGTASLWDVETGRFLNLISFHALTKPPKIFKGKPEGVVLATFSPDWRKVAIISVDYYRIARVWSGDIERLLLSPDTLIQALEDPTSGLRRPAAWALGQLKDTAALPSLTKAAGENPDWIVRSLAVSSLGRLGDSRAIPILTQLRADPDSHVREEASKALEELRSGGKTGLEEQPGTSRAVVETIPWIGQLLPELVGRIPSDHPTTTPMRFLVDAKLAQDARVLRLLQLAVKLRLEGELPIEAAGVATEEELARAQAELPNQASRDLLRQLVYTYVPADEATYAQARALAEALVPGLHRDFVITRIDRSVVSWFLEALERLGIRDLNQELQQQIETYLTAA